MKVITKNDLLKELPSRYRKQYPDGRVLSTGIDTQAVYDKLINDESLTTEKAAEIIGNDSWTRLQCYECNENKDEVILFGKIDYDEAYYIACENCLTKAINKLKYKNK